MSTAFALGGIVVFVLLALRAIVCRPRRGVSELLAARRVVHRPPPPPPPAKCCEKVDFPQNIAEK